MPNLASDSLLCPLPRQSRHVAAALSVTSMKLRLPQPNEALPGRDEPMAVIENHLVLGSAMTPPFDAGIQVIYLGMGCFWGAERMMWRISGVHTTAVGYTGGLTPNPTYEEVCSGATGHTEAVLVAFDPEVVRVERLLRCFWEGHDPTQGMRQGNDLGTQYRSAIYFAQPEHESVALASRDAFQKALAAAGFGAITTEIREADTFYYAEPYHQQYLQRVPNGYCGLGGTGVEFVAENPEIESSYAG